MFIRKLIFKTIISLMLVVSVSCSKDDDPAEIQLSYGFEALEVTFQSVGESTAPVVIWDGETGVFSLKNPVDGISIDSNSGIVEWNKFLPVGENIITIVAQNQQSQAEVKLNIESTLKDTYWLGWQNNDTASETPVVGFITRQFKFNSDGSIEVQLIGDEDSMGVGVWSRNKDVVEINFCLYCAGMDPFSIPEYNEHSFYSGTLLNSGDEGATVRGQQYVIRFDPDSTTLRGQFGFRISNENFDF